MNCNENWQGKKEILVILAHPDDPEFFLGGTIARWVNAGHCVRYLLLTKGDKGATDEYQAFEAIKRMRVQEQEQAGKVFGVSTIEFLDYEDGYIIPDLALRKAVVRIIRKYKPNILVTCDPTNFFPSQTYINHPDHRYAGQVVLDAVFPAAGNHFFFPDLIGEGYQPHDVEEVWMSLTNQPDVILDVTAYWGDRLTALKRHVSQIGDPAAFDKHMAERVSRQPGEPFKYEEKFRVIKFRRKND